MTKKDLSVIYYTSNFLETENPFFLENTKKQLVKAIGDLPLIVVSFRPVPKESFVGYKGEYSNVVAGHDFELYQAGRHHLNIYKQIMYGASFASTPYVAMAEDDILYSYEHFHNPQIDKEFASQGDVFLYDMSKVSIFTWSGVPMFSFRSKRQVVNQLIAPSERLANALQERFARVKELLALGKEEESILHVFGDIGRYEKQLGVTVQPTFEIYCDNPSIVFSHPKAYGYLTQGKRKRLGDIKIIELYGWGRADKLLDEIWGKTPRE
jgi:hypothetical protein